MKIKADCISVKKQSEFCFEENNSYFISLPTQNIKNFSLHSMKINKNLNSRKNVRNFTIFIVLLIVIVIISTTRFFVGKKIEEEEKESIKLQFQKIYYMVDVDLFISDYPYSFITFKVLNQYIPALRDLGITDLVLFDTNIDETDGNTFEDFYSLVKNAKNHDINLNIVVESQFSVRKEDSDEYSDELFARNSKNKKIEEIERIIFNSSNENFINFVIERMKKFVLANISDYFLLNNPHKITEIEENGKEPVEVSREIDLDLLFGRSKMLIKYFPSIKIYYSYVYHYESIGLKRNLFKNSVVVILIDAHVFLNLKKNAELFFYLFSQNEEEGRKVLYFDVSISKQQNLINRFFLGMYLFSPNEIFLSAEDDWIHMFTIHNNISDIQEQKLCPKRKKLDQRFSDVIKLKRKDLYFAKNSILVYTMIYNNSTLIALRGKKRNNDISNMILLLTCFNFTTEKILIKNIFKETQNKKILILYDNFNTEIKDKEIETNFTSIRKGQVIILKVV